MRLSLRNKIQLLIAGAVAALAFFIVLALTALSRDEINRAIYRDSRSAGAVLNQLLNERTASLTHQSLLLSRLPALTYSVKTGDPSTVSDTLTDYLKQMHADQALITDARGDVLGYAVNPIHSGEGDFAAEKAPRPHSSALKTAGVGQALAGEPWKGVVARGNRLYMAVTVPMRVDGDMLGTFTAFHAIGADEAVALKNILGSHVAFVVNGRVVHASTLLPTVLPQPSEEPELLTLEGSKYYALYAELPNTVRADHMGFVTLLPYQRAMGLYLWFRMAFVWVSGLALLLALGAGALMARHLTAPLESVVRAAHTLRDGEWPDEIPVRRNDEIGLLQSVFNEMTVAVRTGQERLLALVDTDPLTELDNHRHFHERLEQEARRCQASGERLAMLLVDLDHFHRYNESHGHAAGDAALQQVADLLRSELPEVAIPARYGGEEFAVLLPGHDIDQAAEAAERLRLAMQRRGPQNGGEALTLSIGCAEYGRNTAKPEGLVLAADLAVSQAKQLGRNRVCRFDSLPGADETADPYQLHRFFHDQSLATIQALAAAVDAKDPYTQGHSIRVAEYAADLARHLGMSEDQAQLIYTTGTVHDVGKIGVPDAVLKKPARLDEEERAVIETHPVLGDVIVRKAPQLAFTLPGVRHHHERWDGNGYPDGLAGESIPLMARILAVADSYDAMTSDRPYRKGMAVRVALAEIERGAGTQFDPELAPAFVQMILRQTALPMAA